MKISILFIILGMGCKKVSDTVKQAMESFEKSPEPAVKK